MRIKNTTKIDSDLVKEIIRFVRPSGISNFDVMIKNGEQLAGKAYTQGSNYHSTASPFIICRVPAETSRHTRGGATFIRNEYPTILRTYQYGQLKGRIYYLANRIEALVYLAAHELRHLWQAKATSKRGYAWGARGRYSEIDTESYAIKMLRTWRRRNL